MTEKEKQHKPPLFFLMGPTAAGKTPLAIELVKAFPLEIISVDSAMIYRGMDIGTAKPDAATLKQAPHRLIDIRDPAESYSAGEFREDALRAIKDIHNNGKIPLLVGGTMLYFRVLQQGLASLPTKNQNVRQALLAQAESAGWQALHAELARIDPVAASRIHPNDSQRIQRALEVYQLTGEPLSRNQADTKPLQDFNIISLIVTPSERALLHERIALRFQDMLAKGFMSEVEKLYQHKELSPDLPALRAVGYRQAWSYLSGECSYDEMCEKAIAATRQLAKRQLTWLKPWPDAIWFDSADADLFKKVSAHIALNLKE